MEKEIKDVSNPVGAVIQDEGIENFIVVMSANWDEQKEASPWWKIWKKISFSKITGFLLKALDDLIAYVDEFVDVSGPDKKATVLNAIGRLYDYIVIEAMPVWMKPFSKSIKNYIINDLVSTAIDWIVDKYRHGDWRKKNASELQLLWSHQVVRLNYLSGVPGGILPK